MAEIVVSFLFRKLFIGVRESIVNQPGTRWLQLEQAREVPDEEPLNLHLLGETFLHLFATAFGLLASVWATVVLLGGFATSLDKMDFWFATIIVFIESSRYVYPSF
uniref:Uncharacterized protein n=1 Tax=Oryza rufipogon TaxID=4529 RepID=A0A0E0MW67_ORYRU